MNRRALLATLLAAPVLPKVVVAAPANKVTTLSIVSNLPPPVGWRAVADAGEGRYLLFRGRTLMAMSSQGVVLCGQHYDGSTMELASAFFSPDGKGEPEIKVTSMSIVR